MKKSKLAVIFLVVLAVLAMVFTVVGCEGLTYIRDEENQSGQTAEYYLL